MSTRALTITSLCAGLLSLGACSSATPSMRYENAALGFSFEPPMADPGPMGEGGERVVDFHVPLRDGCMGGAFPDTLSVEILAPTTRDAYVELLRQGIPTWEWGNVQVDSIACVELAGRDAVRARWHYEWEGRAWRRIEQLVVFTGERVVCLTATMRAEHVAAHLPKFERCFASFALLGPPTKPSVTKPGARPSPRYENAVLGFSFEPPMVDAGVPDAWGERVVDFHVPLREEWSGGLYPDTLLVEVSAPTTRDAYIRALGEGMWGGHALVQVDRITSVEVAGHEAVRVRWHGTDSDFEEWVGYRYERLVVFAGASVVALTARMDPEHVDAQMPKFERCFASFALRDPPAETADAKSAPHRR